MISRQNTVIRLKSSDKLQKCDFAYVGEFGRYLAIPLKQHRTYIGWKIHQKIHTRTSRSSSISDQHKSAFADHVALTNHLIVWEDLKILHQESDKFTRSIRDSIWIRRIRNKTMNIGEGTAYNLNHMYDHIIQNSKFTPFGYTIHYKEKPNQIKRPAKSVSKRRCSMWVTGYM